MVQELLSLEANAAPSPSAPGRLGPGSRQRLWFGVEQERRRRGHRRERGGRERGPGRGRRTGRRRWRCRRSRRQLGWCRKRRSWGWRLGSRRWRRCGWRQWLLQLRQRLHLAHHRLLRRDLHGDNGSGAHGDTDLRHRLSCSPDDMRMRQPSVHRRNWSWRPRRRRRSGRRHWTERRRRMSGRGRAVQWSRSWRLVLWRAVVLLSLAEPTAELVGQLLRLRMPGLKRIAGRRKRGYDHLVAIVYSSVTDLTGFAQRAC